MKFVGHTMGTPNLTVAEAIKLYQTIGLDGIEIVAQEGGAFSIDDPADKIETILSEAKKLPDGVVTLTPYYWDINNIDPKIAEENICGMKRAIDLAKKMGAGFVRAYGGKEEAGGTWEENWKNAVAAMKEIGRYASGTGVTVLVENHPGTVTRTGENTYKLINEAGFDSVKALYDPANVLHDTEEDWKYTFEVQKDIIRYVHVKDYYMEGTERKACVVGKGIVPWSEIMKLLSGYRGYLSFEYEKRWYPDQLPDAETGVKECVDYIKSLL